LISIDSSPAVQAVYYLVTTDTYQVEGVHFAVALYYLGTLRQPSPADRRDFRTG
jgi:hypothetical protein